MTFTGAIGAACMLPLRAIINASGRPRIMVGLMLVTVAVSVGTAFVIVRTAAPGASMLVASATATSIGNATGLVLALIYLKKQFDAGPPLMTVVRVAAAAALAIVAARVFPSGGKLMGLITLGVVGLVFVAALIILRELGPADGAKLKRILGRK